MNSIGQKINIITNLIIAAIFASIFSQIEVISFVFRPLMYLLWILVAVLLVIFQHGTIYVSKFLQFFILVYVLYIIFSLICAVLGYNHLNGEYTTLIAAPLLMSFIGEVYGRKMLMKELQKLAIAYVIGATIFAVWVNVEYFPSYTSWLNQVVYVFKQKNSAAQIWCSAIYINLFIVQRTKILKIFCYGTSIYLLFLTAISQCRTALLAIGITIIIYTLFYSKKRICSIISLIIIIIILWNIPMVQEFFNQALFLEKYESADLNTVSSGRIELFKEAWKEFCYSPIVGQGYWYVDCSYLCILAESGIIGFVLIESIWIYKIYNNYKNRKRFKPILILITIFYIVESVLEGYPPFGPGVCSFMFWLLSAAIVNMPKWENNQVT